MSLILLANTIIASHGITDIFPIAVSSHLVVHCLYPTYILLSLILPRSLLLGGFFIHSVVHFAHDMEILAFQHHLTAFLLSAAFVGLLFRLPSHISTNILYVYMLLFHVPHHYFESTPMLLEFNSGIVAAVLITTHLFFWVAQQKLGRGRDDSLPDTSNNTHPHIHVDLTVRLAIGAIMAHSTYHALYL